MKESGSMIKPKERECTFTKMEPLILVSGLMISSTVMEYKNGLMELNMKATSKKDSRKGMELSFGQMVASTRANLKTIILKALVIMCG
jgi:hypothetical protein